MKKLILLLMIFCSLFLSSCVINEPTLNVPKDDTVDDSTQNDDLKNDNTTGDLYTTVSIEEAIEIARSVGEELSEVNLSITGTIASVSNPEYGNMKITDGTHTIGVYGLYGENNVQYKDLEDKPVKGDTITIYGKVHCFNDEPEFKNAVIVSFTHVKAEVDASYVELTIAEAREVAKESNVIINGVVAQITYAFGHVPNGFYVVDETGSIYVYGEDAQSVKVGNTVKLAGTKDYYILEKEINSAQKYGYQGCCQLKDLTLLENSSTNTEFNKSWIQETTVKNIVETSVTENITTNIYKVNALIKKVPGSGFVNYYFYDIDNKTGGYAYTANNGSDFAWLDEFDGKICTVYLSPINCKSTTSGCFYRFIPVLVSYDNYEFNLNDAPDYALTYEVYDQFEKEYDADPMLEVITNVSSELLGFTNVVIEYSSSDADVLEFVQENGKTIFHTKNPGTATVTMKATHNGNVSSKTIDITVKEAQSFETITVAEAIASNDDTIVTVKGVVVSSLVNQTGFYISDSTGIIAVTCSSEALEGISLGNEIVVKGSRIHRKDAGKTHAGQSVIKDAEILINYYGSHKYDTSKFDTTKSLNEVYSLDVNTDYSTTVYVLNAIVVFEGNDHYTNCKLKSPDGAVKLTLYSSSGNQYSWLEEYTGKEVTVELAVCNWNNKTYYTGCVISVTYNGVKTLNNLNFEN